MGTIKSVYNWFSQAMKTLPDAINNTVSANSAVLIDINRDQLLSGRDADGNLLSPTYLDDPHFSARSEAERYFRMKKDLEIVHKARLRHATGLDYPEKPSTTPNLIITGQFHDGFFIRVSKGAYEIDSSYSAADDINSKYKGRVYGLSPKAKEYFYYGWVRPAIEKHFK